MVASKFRKDKKTYENNNMRVYRWRVWQIVSFSATGMRFVNRSAGMPYPSRVVTKSEAGVTV